jgi:glyoxylase-like metal-dependent hydrolase (beta-lactamase superfamily II)
VIWSGAHTRGHQSVLVQSAVGEVCIAGDVVSLAANAVRPGPMTPAIQEAEAFLSRVRVAGWELIASHEPAMRQHRWFVGVA